MVPHELALGEIYVPPLLVVGTIALLLGYATIRLLNRYRLSRHFVAPALVFVSIVAIYAMIIGKFIIPT